MVTMFWWDGLQRYPIDCPSWPHPTMMKRKRAAAATCLIQNFSFTAPLPGPKKYPPLSEGKGRGKERKKDTLKRRRVDGTISSSHRFNRPSFIPPAPIQLALVSVGIPLSYLFPSRGDKIKG